MMSLRRSRRSPARRAGVAAVELAVCLPAICVLVMASIESCSMIFLNQTLCASGYEGVRAAIQQGATNDEVIARCNEILDARQVADASIQLSPADVSLTTSGEQISVTISAPCDANSVMPAWFFGNRTISAQAIMVRE